MKKNKFLFCIGLLLTVATIVNAQSVTWISSTEGNVWQKSKVKLQSKSEQNPVLQVDGTENGVVFKNWGTTFNELCWDALGVLTRTEQDEILYNIFSPQGDLRITRGRISMGANDYARSWYSCDEVEGDFELRYFNINRDKQTIIPFIRAAQKYNPNLTFWISPWCPPSWMKINTTGDMIRRITMYPMVRMLPILTIRLSASASLSRWYRHCTKLVYG